MNLVGEASMLEFIVLGIIPGTLVQITFFEVQCAALLLALSALAVRESRLKKYKMGLEAKD